MTAVKLDGPGPLVSVVIPTYNCERYIEQTLAGVLAQTHKAIEVLVVDDGSTDRTPEIVQAHGAGVRLIRQANQGVCVARNRGFEESRGEYLCFLDHDDFWFPWKIARQVEALAADPQVGVAFTDFALWLPERGRFPQASALDPGDPGPPAVDADFSGYIYHQFLLDCWALTSTAMIRREVFAPSGGFDPGLPYSEDWDLWLRLSRQHRFIKQARVSTLYRQHGDQGNRKLREIDYRTRMLHQASRSWGLASADGRCVTPRAFKANLARFHIQFALHQLEHAQRRRALGSIWQAWMLEPLKVRHAAVLAAVAVGWRPSPPAG